MKESNNNPDSLETKASDEAAPPLRYSREKRLARSSEAVRRMHEEDYIQRPGLFRSLTATRSLRALFFAILLLVAVNFFIFFTQSTKNKGTVAGVACVLESMIYEKSTFATITLLENKKKAEEKEVAISVRFLSKDGTLIDKKQIQSIYIGAEVPLSAKSDEKEIAAVEAYVTVNDKAILLKQKPRGAK